MCSWSGVCFSLSHDDSLELDDSEPVASYLHRVLVAKIQDEEPTMQIFAKNSDGKTLTFDAEDSIY
jgi:hypothetical protein